MTRREFGRLGEPLLRVASVLPFAKAGLADGISGMPARAETEWDTPVVADCSCGDTGAVGGGTISTRRDPISSQA